MTALAATSRKDIRFWDKIADKYARSAISDEASYQKKLEMTRDLLTPYSAVLELGCGTGSTAITHAPYVRHIVATDISGRMLEIADTKAREAGVENIEFRKASFDEVAADNADFDMVLCMSLIHLLPNRDDAISKIWKVLKPGGVFVSSTACLRDMNPLIRLILPLGRATGLIPSVQVFSGEALLRSVTEAGFMIEHRWRPAKDKAMFIIARKPGEV